MTIRATADQRFNRRNLIFALICLAIGLWGAFDAFIVYPKKLKQSEAYARMLQQVKEEGQDSQELGRRWKALTEEKGWRREKPKSPEEVRGNILFNYCLVGAGAIGCVIFVIKYFRVRSSWVEADDNEIRTSWGTSLQFKDIQLVDKVKWEKKGLAKVFYKPGDGAEQVFVMDDFKFQREPMGQIMERVLRDLKPGQIKQSLAKEEEEFTDEDQDDQEKPGDEA